MSWGYRIAFVYIAFVCMIGYLIYRCTQENIDLVADNYYEKELKFQSELKMKENTLNLSEQPTFKQVEGKNEVSLSFPDSTAAGNVNGNVTFFRPDNSKLDFTTMIKLNNEGVQYFTNEKLVHGNWKIKLTYNIAGKSYMQEEKIFIK